MWNWREFYQLAERAGKYTRVLYSGESLVQIPQEESMGEQFFLHTLSGIYRGKEGKTSFCGYDARKVSASRLLWLYLVQMPDSGEVLFNTVFLRYGGRNKEADKRHRHGIRMVYKRMAQETDYGEIMGKRSRQGIELSGENRTFGKLVVIGRKETEIRRMTVAELLEVFGEAVDEKGLLMLSEQNVRLLCQDEGEKKEDLRQNMG